MVMNIVYSTVVACLVEVFLIANVSMISSYLRETRYRDSFFLRLTETETLMAFVYLLSGIAIFSVTFFALQERSMRYISRISSAIQNISEGDLNTTIEVRGDDEFTAMAVNLNKMVGDIRNLMDKEREAERTKNELITNVAHDLRTPLTSIIGSTSAMIENPDLPEEDRLLLLTDVRDDAQWLIRVVENLLSITRMGDTTTRLVKNPEPAEEILGAVTAKFRKRYPDVRIRVSVPEDLLFVPMDAVLISQVLSNLLENAVVHGGGHTTEIRLSVRREGPEAVFAVEDNGDGIEHKVLPHLFDGTLAAAAGDTENGGKRNMGLGLSVCQAIIHAHSGSIEAHNLMEGAEFVFRLPLEQEEEKA